MSATEDGVSISVVVDHVPESAFRLFTAAIGDWWQRPTDHASTITLDEKGLVETSARGRSTIAAVTVWDPPRRLELDWNGPHAKPGDRVLVGFEPVGTSHTRVTVQHLRTALRPAAADGGALGLWWADRLRAMSNINSES